LKTAPDWRLLSQNCCCLHFIGDKIQTLAEIEANWLKKKKIFCFCIVYILLATKSLTESHGAAGATATRQHRSTFKKFAKCKKKYIIKNTKNAGIK
jgi:hypothetical protein